MHEPVLLRETLKLLSIRAGGSYIDATAGSGGHAAAILESSAPDGRLLALDRDQSAVRRLESRLESFGPRVKIVRAEYERLADIALAEGFAGADGVLFDLGVSSEQLDSAERGFSFRRDGPLDMRMNRQTGLTAADLLAGMSDWRELAGLLRRYGEEPRAGRIARAIMTEQEREPIRNTGRLASIVARAAGGAGRARHPATRVFQALRIAVNGEIEGLSQALEQALLICRPGGRVAVISFHSLEDREAKRFCRDHAGRWESLAEGGRRRIGLAPPVEIETPRPVWAGEAERRTNPRSRTARLRVVRRIDVAAGADALPGGLGARG